MAQIADKKRLLAHLLRRAGFGPVAADLAPADAPTFDNLAYDAAVDKLIDFPTDPDPATDLNFDPGLKAGLAAKAFELDRLVDIELEWLYRMIYAKRPLQEKMTLFWHGLFATAYSKVESTGFMRQMIELLRANALGNFRDIVKKVAKDPAMMIWLDTVDNVKSDPNENFGRELMELFTLGRVYYDGSDNYTQVDVRQCSLCFTGWKLNSGIFQFNSNQHTTGAKTLLGQTVNAGGVADGEQAIDIILNHKRNGETFYTAAYFLAYKLYLFFVHDNPDAIKHSPPNERFTFLKSLAQNLTDSNYDVKAAMRFLFKSAHFQDETNYLQHIKSPMEFYAGFLRTMFLDFGLKEPEFDWNLHNKPIDMGQELFNPPNVGGWRGGTSWVSTARLFARYDAVNNYVANVPRTFIDTTLLNNKFGLDPTQPINPQALINKLMPPLLVEALPPGMQTYLYNYALQEKENPRSTIDPNVDENRPNKKTRGLILLICTTPQYQLN